MFLSYSKLNKSRTSRRSFLIDAALPDFQVMPDLDTLLFNLLILGELTDNRGRVWRRNPYDFYILEITYTPPQVCY